MKEKTNLNAVNEAAAADAATVENEAVMTDAATAESLSQPAAAGEPVKRKKKFKEYFSATKIAYIAVFTALAYVVTFLEFPIFPSVPYANQLKLDFANVFFLIEGFISGPVETIISILVKELLCWADSSTMGVGEIANFIMSFAYVIVPSVGYRFLKGRKWVVILLAIACVVQTGTSFVVNMLINFPFFGMLFHFDGSAAFWQIWPFVIYFNLIKSVVISVIVMIIYKPLSHLIKITAAKFEKPKSKANINQD